MCTDNISSASQPTTDLIHVSTPSLIRNYPENRLFPQRRSRSKLNLRQLLTEMTFQQTKNSPISAINVKSNGFEIAEAIIDSVLQKAQRIDGCSVESSEFGRLLKLSLWSVLPALQEMLQVLKSDVNCIGQFARVRLNARLPTRYVEVDYGV